MTLKQALETGNEMHRLELTLPTPEENLALDEALLVEAENHGDTREFLRVWQFADPFVVLGRGSRIVEETNREACSQRKIPILRRTSGGAAIVAGDGCLVYSLVLSIRRRPELRSIDATHKFVLDRMAAAISTATRTVRRAGISDLVLVDPTREITSWRKVSGNSMRRGKTHILYHGTLLFGFDLELVSLCLRTPPRMPDYRHRRPHRGFVANLSIPRQDLCRAMRECWPSSPTTSYPETLVNKLVETKYALASWNERH